MNLNLYHNIYEKSLSENEKNIIFWEKYLESLSSLDLSDFTKKLSVPVLVPIGNRVFFRGELKHTNEVTVALGADYFTKCSVSQAEILRQHRIKDAKSKIESLHKERDYLKNQLSISKETVSDKSIQNIDIIEFVSHEEDEAWQKQHRENVRQHKQRKDKDNQGSQNEMSNEELWNRLDELELQEEMENELTIDESMEPIEPTSTAKDDDEDSDEDSDYDDDDDDDDCSDLSDEMNAAKVVNELYLANYGNRRKIFQQPSKLHLFEQVVDRHRSLKKMVAEIKAKQRKAKTEVDLMARLDDIEMLEKLEDEIAILDDMLGSDDDDDDIEESEEVDSANSQPKKSVAFADEDDSETFELTFKHSKVEPSLTPYDPQKGITKPSDIVKAYSSLFNNETISILKKTKSDASPTASNSIPAINEEDMQDIANHDSNLNSPIVIKDVVEKVECNDNNVNQDKRPMSLFKKKRQQLKE